MVSRSDKKAEDRMRTVDMQVDTVDVEQANGILGYYLPDRYSITLNYVKEGDYIDDEAITGTTLIHEQKHRDNYIQGMHKYVVSPEQAYKRNMHDEISANIAELVALRDEYIQTGDIAVFDKKPKFAFYKEAIEKGEINPNSEYVEDFQKDMSLIVNGTQKMWMEQHADGYVDACLYRMTSEGDYEKKEAEHWDENYQKSLKIAYTIGGVDFTQFMEHDVEIPQTAKTKISDDVINNPDEAQQEYRLSDAEIFEKCGFPPYDGSISLAQYKQLLYHQMAIDKLAHDSPSHNEDGSVCSPYERLQYLYSDAYRESTRETYNILVAEDTPDCEFMRKEFPDFESFYNYNLQIDSDFAPEVYKGCLEKAGLHEDFINRMVDFQAHEYAKTGKDFPQEDNPENYQQALQKMFGKAYDLYKPFCLDPQHNLSAQTFLFVLEYEDGLRGEIYRKLMELRYRLTHITDENGDSREVGLWEKMKHTARKIKQKVTDAFSEDETEDKNNQEGRAQRRIHVYREWQNKDGERVSEVQYQRILDLNKPIIKQPVISRRTEANAQAVQKPTEQPDNTKVDVAREMRRNHNSAKESYEAKQPSRDKYIGNPAKEAADRRNRMNGNFRRNMKQHGF